MNIKYMCNNFVFVYAYKIIQINKLGSIICETVIIFKHFLKNTKCVSVMIYKLILF